MSCNRQEQARKAAGRPGLAACIVIGVMVASAGALAAESDGGPRVERPAAATATEAEADSAYECFLKWLKGEPCDAEAEVVA